MELVDAFEAWLNAHQWAIMPLAIWFGLSPFLAAKCLAKADQLSGRKTSAWIKWLAD